MKNILKTTLLFIFLLGMGFQFVYAQYEGGYIVDFEPEQFDYSEGLARVKLDTGWGFIDKAGKVVIYAKYDDVYGFEDGLAAVKLNGKYGVIDKRGNVKVSYKYDVIEFLIDGMAKAKLNGKWGGLGRYYKEVIPFKFDEINSLSSDFAKAKLNGKWGVIDKKGVITPFKYDGIKHYSEGLAAVQLNGKWGFVDETGQEVIPLKYDNIDKNGFSGNLIRVIKNNEGYVIDNEGNEGITFADYNVRLYIDVDGKLAYVTDIERNKLNENGVVNLENLYFSALIYLYNLINSDEIVEQMNLRKSKAEAAEYDDLKIKRKQVLQDALPYMERAHMLKSENVRLAKALMDLYLELNMEAKSKTMKAKLADLEGR